MKEKVPTAATVRTYDNWKISVIWNHSNSSIAEVFLSDNERFWVTEGGK